jgi:hypothetical protein
MSPTHQQYIVECAERCERELACEFAHVSVGDFESAARSADRAELYSYLAFVFATCGRVHWRVGV